MHIWSNESMAGAIQEIPEGKMVYRKASKAYSMPQTPLERKVKEARQMGLSSKAAAKKIRTWGACYSRNLYECCRKLDATYVFPRKRGNLLIDDAPPGSFAVYHVSDWRTKETFLAWFRWFLDFSNPGFQKPVLLILDCHSSHAKSLELINLARESNVGLLCFPLHTTHRLQPLNVSFKAPLSAFYEQESSYCTDCNTEMYSLTICLRHKVPKSSHLITVTNNRKHEWLEEVQHYQQNSSHQNLHALLR
ncbi:hypothetical protein PR048_018523 [Dryococelus australis]|uniref:DDE-1 domain-containing protein n=1 Tax=Dryococelus australis TaxID=614101 RepID=A0ABQ9HCN0_9NEOP|nr:hypothetical protein PR048_018523 [Dryococelus australis]